jgi:trimeric autotransporter adhesin
VSAGQPGSATISVIPLGGSTQTVSFSCGNLPAKLTCAFAPASVTLDGVNAGTVKLTVSSGVITARALAKSNMWGAASTMAFAGLLLPFVRRKHLKHLFGTLAILTALSLFAVGCGSSNSTPAAQKTTTFVVNVTTSAGAGSAAKTLPIVITVNQ